MSGSRAVFILTGGGLLTLGLLGVAVREFQLGPFADSFQGMSPGVAYGLFGASAVLGGLLLVFAPTNRKPSRRVSLDRAPATEPDALRPRYNGHKPATSGIQDATAVRSESAAPSAPAPTPNAPAPAPAQGAAANGHPNDPAHADTTPAAPSAPIPDPAQVDPDSPSALRARLAELDKQANNAKVRYGLGQLSASGYKQILHRIDAQRGEIEERLVEDELNS